METPDSNVYPTIIGACFGSLFLDLGARSAIFWHLKRGTFGNVLEPFYPLYEAKISNRSLSVVYGSVTLIFLWALETISHQWFNRGNDARQVFFLGHPTGHTT